MGQRDLFGECHKLNHADPFDSLDSRFQFSVDVGGDGKPNLDSRTVT